MNEDIYQHLERTERAAPYVENPYDQTLIPPPPPPPEPPHKRHRWLWVAFTTASLIAFSSVLFYWSYTYHVDQTKPTPIVVIVTPTMADTQALIPTATPTPVPTENVAPTPSQWTPSGNTIDPTAASIITSPQTSSAIDNNLSPTKPTTSFTTGQDVYVTFNISSNGRDGYIEAKWYQNGQYLSTRQFHHSASNDVGYFSRTFVDSGDGTVELYWCVQSDCSDAQLADVANFTVIT